MAIANRRGGDANIEDRLIKTCSVGSLFMREAVMLKGFMIAVLTLLFLSMCDQYTSDGKYTDAVIMVAKQIGHSFGA
ncbi:hypothetical protein [Bradyrhizobium sp. 192]|uniref:hypothetical protein n=1 Tax=Bradyrhizobium sp. 192 TaxID=2782660 RepID=UPI001FFF5155|nr:hypothetical protein [Bradyrhizobium sp. 192]UPJ54998.1 hypothetical protein IVB24_20090 [Bradyrhizobium sp. 192]